jgi:hypothetical protein
VANPGNVSTPAPAPAAAPAGGDSISLPTAGEDAAIAAGVLLLITGAGFVGVRGARKGPGGLPA